LQRTQRVNRIGNLLEYKVELPPNSPHLLNSILGSIKDMKQSDWDAWKEYSKVQWIPGVSGADYESKQNRK